MIDIKRERFEAWRPIKTAPKDKRVLLLTSTDNMYCGQWVQHPVTQDEAFLLCVDEEGNQSLIKLSECTHWHELPQPPREQS